MTETTALTAREATPVSIGLITLYCEDFKASGTRRFVEESTVQGYDVITNEAVRAMELTFKGRVYDDRIPLHLLLYAYNMLHGEMKLDIKYRGLVFNDCHIKSFTVEDSGEDYISAAITVITTELVGLESES